MIAAEKPKTNTAVDRNTAPATIDRFTMFEGVPGEAGALWVERGSHTFDY